MSLPVFTNKALKEMKDLGLSEAQVADTFNTGVVEKWSVKLNGAEGFNSVKKYPGYEVGAGYIRDKYGVYKITSVWKRQRR